MTDNNIRYHHRQIGHTVRIVFAIVIIVLALLAVIGGWTFVVIAPLVLLFIMGIIFNSLTVKVTDQEVVWYFGPGLWKHRKLHNEIADAKPVRNKWWWGFGIRLTPHGLLYNVDGLDAVEITMLSGKKRRIGTDEPEALSRAINEAQ